MRLTVALLVLLSCLPEAGSAEIYKWTDANGVVHFGDKAGSAKAQVVTVKVNSFEHVSYATLKQRLTGGPQPATGGSSRVLLYGTTWCGYCKQARQYFQANGIAYADLDIEHDRSALAAFKALGGRGVPVIIIGNQRMNGFNADGFRRLQRQAAAAGS